MTSASWRFRGVCEEDLREHPSENHAVIEYEFRFLVGLHSKVVMQWVDYYRKIL